MALVIALRDAGFNVLTSREAANDGKSDEDQLRFASYEGRAILTANVGDFAVLHRGILEGGAHHAGVLIRRQSLTPRQVARAVARVEELPGALTDRFEFLSSWLNR